MDWEQIKNSKPPFEKGTRGPEELNAINKYNSLKPTFTEKLAKAKFEQRKAIAYEEIAKSKVRDTENYAAWEALVECADKVLNGDIDSYYDAINAYDPFVELSKLGSDFEFGTDDSRLMEIEFCTKFDEIIPHEKLTLTPAGKVSYKSMSKTEMYDITQDYVCSLAIRLAREIFALIPVDTVIVHADENSKDAFGNDARYTILSVKFERAVFERTNFDYVDASDFVATFIYNEKFLKTQGFRPIERLTTDSVDVRIVPTEGSIVGRKATETKMNFSKIEYPWGWYTENEAFLKPRDTEMYRLIKKGFNSENIDEKIEGIKELLSYTQEYKEECIKKGILFEKYFYEGHMSECGKIKDKTKQWRKELEELEENYLDVKEAESAIAEAKETMKDDLEKLIKANPGILQKDLYSHFNKHVKHLLLEELYKLQLEGKLKKEKFGNSNKLWIE